MNESADPAKFKPAPPNVVLHEFLLLPGWVKTGEFEDLRQWLVEQGFVIVRANGPEPWRTYPLDKVPWKRRKIQSSLPRHSDGKIVGLSVVLLGVYRPANALPVRRQERQIH